MKYLILTILTFIFASSSVKAQDLDSVFGLKNVEVVRVEVDGLQIRHSSGVKKILTENLPDNIKQKYGLGSPENKTKLEEIEKKKMIVKDYTQKLQSLLMVRGTVLQVLPEGVLLTDTAVYKFKRGEKGDGEENFEMAAWSHPIMYVKCSNKGIRDGVMFSDMCQESSIPFQYSNTLGQNKTVLQMTSHSSEFKRWYFSQFPTK